MSNEVLIQTIQGFIDAREKTLASIKETAKLLSNAIPVLEQEIETDKQRIEALR